jgi:Lrp/AsnC family transcriptional regulator, regulator for asnA, asnC and gidA
VPVRRRRSVDELGTAIIEQLQQDGRRSYAHIGAAVGLSEGAVRLRVQKMVDSKDVQIVAVADPIRVGLRRQAMVKISVNGDVHAVAEKLAAIPEVVYIMIVAGPIDILAEVVVRDDQHLLAVLDDRIRTLPGVWRTETLLYLRLAKHTAV